MRGCEATLEADCAMGPGSRAECESDCERLRSGECGTEYRALMSCAEGEEVTCSSAGLPAIEACDAEQSAFVACLSACPPHAAARTSGHVGSGGAVAGS